MNIKFVTNTSSNVHNNPMNLLKPWIKGFFTKCKENPYPKTKIKLNFSSPEINTVKSERMACKNISI